MVRSFEATLLHALFDYVSAHGYMINPRSRNMNTYDKAWGEPPTEFNPQELFDQNYKCGNASYDKTARHWPVLKSGFSRADKQPSRLGVRKWTNQLTGTEFELELMITSQHGGPHYLQYACMDDQLDLDPQDARVKYEYLERADSDRGDESFKQAHPKALWIGHKAGLDLPSKYETGRVLPFPAGSSQAIYVSRWKTPKGKCAHGVIVWQWDNPTSCVPGIRGDGPQLTYDQFQALVTPGQKNTYHSTGMCDAKVNTLNKDWKINPSGETFFNCADVLVDNGSGGASAENLRR